MDTLISVHLKKQSLTIRDKRCCPQLDAGWIAIVQKRLILRVKQSGGENARIECS